MIPPVTTSASGQEAGGAVQLTTAAVPFGETWLLERLTIETNSGTVSSFTVRLDGIALGNLIDRSAAGNADVAEYPQPVVVPSGARLIFRWENLSAGAAAAVRYQYQVIRNAAVAVG